MSSGTYLRIDEPLLDNARAVAAACGLSLPQFVHSALEAMILRADRGGSPQGVAKRDISDQGDRAMFRLRIDEQLREAAHRVAAASGLSLSQLVSAALEAQILLVANGGRPKARPRASAADQAVALARAGGMRVRVVRS